ncbi:TRAP transporter substrate-binding protein DctP [Paracoccus methylovorus]|uniref:TRAP transporter substrate-binding protein DctP n=1 Tax=Paracoccus methylovorus TaxID=2812658 RepID=A0ABX7JQ80_9RHOB|nr:TRAP transporter substrate-binding protein DctP [Paracoccus methylovorus]QRZ15144.1 TRAP transporter substrate-binding protein DctP [Paracoccus methylovorus]
MTFNRIAAVATAAALALGASAAQAEMEIRISSAAPPGNPLVDGFEVIKQRMEAAYPGEIKVTIHHSSSLFKQGTELPAMQRGNLEMATPIVYEIEQQLPEYGPLGKPYVYRDVDHMLAVFNGEIGARFYSDVEEKMGVVILDTGYLGTRTIGLRSEHGVTSPDDLHGIKLRMAPGAAYQNLATALGAVPVSMPATEVYLALKTGAIDGQDNPLNLVADWKFDEVTAEFVMTDHLVQPVFFAISGKAWNQLTPDQQQTLRDAAKEGTAEQIRLTRGAETAARERFEAEGKLFSTPDLAPFRASVDAVYAQPGMMKGWRVELLDEVAAVE